MASNHAGNSAQGAAGTSTDGGALLRRIPWNSGETYEGISSHYIRYVGDRYGNAVVVFDGHVSAPSTKDVAHSRRVRSHSSPLVNFTKDMVCTMKKDDFLANQTNKHTELLLNDDLQRQHNDVLHARADTDVLIVETAIACANTKDTVAMTPSFLFSYVVVQGPHHTTCSSDLSLS